MKDQIKIHFDELLLAFLFLILVAVWFFRPDSKEWVQGLLAALLIALRNKGQEQRPLPLNNNEQTNPKEN